MNPPAVFRSKVDWWLALLLLIVPGSQAAIEWDAIAAGSPSTSFWMSIVIMTVLVLLFFPIRYVFEGETVSVQCGVMRWEHSAFTVREVRAVRETFDVMASPALSLDRLSVDLQGRGELLISPKDKVGFLGTLAELDPQLVREDGGLVRRV